MLTFPIEDSTARLMAVLEGYCPDCSNDVRTIEVSGTPEFLEWNQRVGMDGVVSNEWEVIRNNRDSGTIVVKCNTCDKRFDAYKNYGDWTGSS